MTEEISRVPLWPLVFPLFWGAAALFALAMTRHIRVMAAAHPSGSYPLREAPRRAWSVVVHVLAQVRMFRDVRAALMHHLIFWGFVILTIGTATAFATKAPGWSPQRADSNAPPSSAAITRPPIISRM